MSSRKLAIVTGASSGIGLELAKLAAEDGYDLIVAADTPFVEAGPALKEFGVEVEEVEADLATQQGVDQLLCRVGDRRWMCSSPMPGHGSATASSTRPGRMGARHQHQRHRHAVADPADRQANGRARRGQGPDYGFDRGSPRRRLPGGLQWLQGLHRQLLRRAERGDQRQRRHRHLSEAGCDRNRFLPPRGARRTKVGQAKKDDPADVAKAGWDAMKKRRTGGHLRPQEQDAGRGGRT